MESDVLGEADRHLLQLVRAGDGDGWSQLVSRYQRRLLAFANRRVDQSATGQDLVQETFIHFLKSLNSFRGECDLESFLFRILRRRIIDHYRTTGQKRRLASCEISDGASGPSVDQHAMDLRAEKFGAVDDGALGHWSIEDLASADLTASHHARRREQHEIDQHRLSQAIAMITEDLRRSEKFRDLKIAEGLFYAGVSNKQLATLLSVSANEVAVVKHRLVKKLGELVGEGQPSLDFKEPGLYEAGLYEPGLCESSCGEASLSDADLQAVWEWHRPSCPKRSTLGKYTLGILPERWSDFVNFHVETLGCTFCNANLEEFQRDQSNDSKPGVTDQLFQSTIGFLPR
ncbi:RNA polymerase sigma factor, sigma-70 family [Neorhodopirellula lusitana]|uniref:RNA polymerase sigma factor, sigma-70 family n=1 Tax=Neorhodopirellula lusitana TaxID=445327 RepID=A0ABY1QJN7_9BACT|nr:sigma-70 family RNA polymerase sigma factor [Neorhodopirellula lusitana]SMP72562.1 RNA polymerase sigma factor, sigma-70 family [Neorhodopirellula lusitana]